MNRAFYNGISGTKTHQFGIDTWANNIANVNTNGYRANLPQFTDLFNDKLAQISNTGPVQSDQGFGARANSSAISQKQGGVEKSDRMLDVAIAGEGWFGVTSSDGEKVQYTRNGSFSYNKEGNIVNSDGAYLLGTLDPSIQSGKIPTIIPSVDLNSISGQKPIQLPTTLTLGAVPTSTVNLHANLGVEGKPTRFSSHITGPEGKKQLLEINITKTDEKPEAGSIWNLTASIKDLDGNLLFTSDPSEIIFNGNGAIDDFEPPIVAFEGRKIDISLGENNTGLVTLDSADIGKDIQINGLAKGNLKHYFINTEGDIMANFDNGRQSAVGKLALFHFQNDQGLVKIGDNRFEASSNSGDPLFYKDNEGRAILGTKLMTNSIEKSNTSTSEALTQLIIMQKAFDANAKSITTGDQLIQAALRML